MKGIRRIAVVASMATLGLFLVSSSPLGPTPQVRAGPHVDVPVRAADVPAVNAALRDYTDRITAALLGRDVATAVRSTSADSKRPGVATAVRTSIALATEVGGETRTAYADAGTTIVSANVTAEVNSSHVSPHEAVTVLVTLLTDLKDADRSFSTDSGFSEDYELTLTRTGHGFTVTGSKDITGGEYGDGDTSAAFGDDSDNSDQSPISDTYSVSPSGQMTEVSASPSIPATSQSSRR